MEDHPGNPRRQSNDQEDFPLSLKKSLRRLARMNYSETQRSALRTMASNLDDVQSQGENPQGNPLAAPLEVEDILHEIPSDQAGLTLLGRGAGPMDQDVENPADDRSVLLALRAGLRAPKDTGTNPGDHPRHDEQAEDPPKPNGKTLDDVLSAVHAALRESHERQMRREVDLLKKVQTQVSEQLAMERRVADATVVGRLVGLALADTGIQTELRSLTELVSEQQTQIQKLEGQLRLVLEKGTRRNSRSPVPRGTRDRRYTTVGRDHCAGLHCPKCHHRGNPESAASDDSARRVNEWLMDHYKRQTALSPRGDPPPHVDWKDASMHEEVVTANPPSSIGPREAGLVEIQPSEPMFQKAVSYRR